MIFVTVGQMVPFDRLIKTVDLWVGKRKKKDVFAQIGATRYRPKNIKWVDFLGETEFMKYVKQADAIVSHAGTGTIITSLLQDKTILVMPRRAALKEHRTDHQYATAKKFLELGHINVAFDENELLAKLDDLDNMKSGRYIEAHPPTQLIDTIRQFVTRND